MRTIVVGDAHACFDEVCDLLYEKLKLNEYQDRVIFVGDLLDRGPKPRELVELCMEKRFECVMGNHEHNHLERFERPLEKMVHTHRKAREALTQDQWKWIARLPHYIALPEYNAAVVHAGVYPEIPLGCQDENHLMRLGCIKPPLRSSYWPDEVAHEEGWKWWPHFWRGPERVIFGHAYLTAPLVTPHAVGIDTGCVHGGKLTAVVLPEWKIVQVPARQDYIHGGSRGSHNTRKLFETGFPGVQVWS